MMPKLGLAQLDLINKLYDECSHEATQAEEQWVNNKEK